MKHKPIFIIVMLIFSVNILFSQDTVLNKTIDSFTLKVIQQEQKFVFLSELKGKLDTVWSNLKVKSEIGKVIEFTVANEKCVIIYKDYTGHLEYMMREWNGKEWVYGMSWPLFVVRRGSSVTAEVISFDTIRATSDGYENTYIFDIKEQIKKSHTIRKI
jgi:hypothetical protein